MRKFRRRHGMPPLFPRRITPLSRPDYRGYGETNPQEYGSTEDIESRVKPVDAGNAQVAQEGLERMAQVRQAVSHGPPPL